MREDIELQRVALEVELANVRRSTPFPTAEAIAHHGALIARLEAEIAELGPKPEPVPQELKPWTFGGKDCVVRDSSFGTRFERPEGLTTDDSRHSHNYDPHIREFGDLDS